MPSGGVCAQFARDVRKRLKWMGRSQRRGSDRVSDPLPRVEPERRATKHGARKLLATLGLVGGVALIVLETVGSFARVGGMSEVAWFWIVVALLLIAIAMAELLDRHKQ